MVPAETPRHLLLVSLGAIVAAALFGVARAPQSNPATPPSAPPEGYQRMDVISATPLGPEYVVRLADAARQKILTMYVGSSEGMAISLHLAGQHYQRPLSMELMDDAVRQLGAELERVQIDSVRDLAYIGSIHLLQGSRRVELDARPSDALAFALARHAPILVADSVIAALATTY